MGCCVLCVLCPRAWNAVTLSIVIFFIPCFLYLLLLRQVGLDGSPCFHQYIVWARRMSGAYNFVPIHEPDRRMMFAQVAMGESLDRSYYEPLQQTTVPSILWVSPSAQVNIITTELLKRKTWYCIFFKETRLAFSLRLWPKIKQLHSICGSFNLN